jgi:hypothetical protein
MVTHGDEQICGKVIKQAQGEDRNPNWMKASKPYHGYA